MVEQQVSNFTATKINRRSLLKRVGMVGLTLPAAGMLLNACGTDEPVTASSRVTPVTDGQTASTGAAAAVANTEVAELTVTAVDLAFQPTQLSAVAGQKVRLTFINQGAMEHDVQVQGATVSDLKAIEQPASFNARMQELFAQGAPYAGAGAGEQMIVEFTAPEAGAYEYICAVPGHAMAGMKGTLTVTAADGQVAAAPAAAANHGDGHSMSTGAKTGAPYAADRLPLPVVAPPVGTREPQLVKQEVEIREIVGYMDEGIAYEFWTFDGTIPGPMIRVRVGDTVELTLKNPAESTMPHNIDLHAVTGPGGGGHDTLVSPGQSATIRFKALNHGVFVYHCATPPIPHHISSGMYGLIIVEPEGGLPEVDREFYVMQGDFYLEGARGEQGLRGFSMDKMLDERPDYVVFNGGVGAITEDRAFKAQVGETVRIFFGVGGPNIVSSFHVIGEIFDRVMQEGAAEWTTNVQTTLVPAGGATIVDFKCEVPGTLLMVDHSLGRLAKGAVGQIIVEGDANPEVYEVVAAAH